jgi:pimeloyl-ACP methyl ester carboxylesterase
VLVAAEHPELVSGLVLIGPFVRQPKVGRLTRGMLRVAMHPLWAATMWKSYLPKLYAGARPADFADYRGQVVAALKRPGHAKAFSLTTRTSHQAAGSAIDAVTAPTLVIMGAHDPDFPDPAREADWIGQALHGEVVMAPDSGHYPQSQQPELTSSAVLGFLARTAPSA